MCGESFFRGGTEEKACFSPSWMRAGGRGRKAMEPPHSLVVGDGRRGGERFLPCQGECWHPQEVASSPLLSGLAKSPSLLLCKGHMGASGASLKSTYFEPTPAQSVRFGASAPANAVVGLSGL